ncbi:MAG: hypothetical protein WCV81_00040 [Microgenomates group bacterium]|jgi:hypothetical protein
MIDLGQQFGFALPTLGAGFNRLVMPAFEIAGVAVIIYLLIGGIKYMISAGDKNAVASAQQMITHAIIGFILLILLFVIVQFVPEFFGAGALRIIGR